jgi:hypothetical protein
MVLRFDRAWVCIGLGLVCALAVGMLLPGCGQKDPTGPLTGMIYVDSDSTGAAIYLDGDDTGQVTPDTLRDVPNGTHVVTVRLTGFVSLPDSAVVEVSGDQVAQVTFIMTPLAGSRKIVLVEHFTSVNCGPCPEANEVINGILDAFGPEQVLGIEYHPWPADPFYNAAPDENILRSSFYSVSSVPKMFLEGITSPQPTDSAAIVQEIEIRLNTAAPIAITVSDTAVGQSWSGTAELVGLSNTAATDLRGYFVVMEREVNYASPPGTNGEKDFLYVMRAILPSANGQQISIGAGASLNIQEQTDLHPDVDADEVYAIYFIQDYVSKEIYQAGSSLPMAMPAR